MNQPTNNTILNGPTGELTVAFKEAVRKTVNLNNMANNQVNQPIRPVLQGNDSRGAQINPQPQQVRPFQGVQPLSGQAPQFRPPNLQQQIQQQLLQNQQNRFGPPGQQSSPQNSLPGQPLFRPQQRFVAVNPPGTVRHNIRPPGSTGATQNFQNPIGFQGVSVRQRPPLIQQQSLTGQLLNQRSQEGVHPSEVQKNVTLESTNLICSETNNRHEEKETITSTPVIIEKQVEKPLIPSPAPSPQPQQQPQMLPQTPSPQPQQIQPEKNAPVDSTPPATLQLNNSQDSKTSSSPSPQPETVVEAKPSVTLSASTTPAPSGSAEEKSGCKPPKVPRTPTKAGNSARTHSRNKKEGDNDSGVDESTQGTDHTSNGDRTPRKLARNGNRPPGGATPTKNRSFSRGSRSPMMSPDSQPGTPGPTEKKKLPMNKIQVGAAPSPNLKVVKSKIGSLANASHKPGGGNVKIETKKVDVSKAQSRVGAKNEAYTPTGGDKKILRQKLQWNAKSKIGSLDNASHKPKGGDKKIETLKLDFKDKAKSKVGSKDNIQHVAGGGDVKSAKERRNEEQKMEKAVKIIDRKIEIQAESKIKSLENVKHKPGGGEKKIFDDKEYLRQMSGSANENNSTCGSQNSLPSQHSDSREPVSDENLNREN